MQAFPGFRSRPVSLEQPGPSRRIKDPVCGMELEPWQDGFKLTVAAGTFHFCASECRQAFLLFPGRFRGEEGSP
jgi:YHS domain-containing protein